jgi:hypothetical protein
MPTSGGFEIPYCRTGFGGASRAIRGWLISYPRALNGAFVTCFFLFSIAIILGLVPSRSPGRSVWIHFDVRPLTVSSSWAVRMLALVPNATHGVLPCRI